MYVVRFELLVSLGWGNKKFQEEILCSLNNSDLRPLYTPTTFRLVFTYDMLNSLTFSGLMFIEYVYFWTLSY